MNGNYIIESNQTGVNSLLFDILTKYSIELFLNHFIYYYLCTIFDVGE